MKKRHFLFIFLILGLGVLIFMRDETALETQIENSSVPTTKSRTPTSTITKVSTQQEEKKSFPKIVLDKIPVNSPSELRERWSHTSNFEDADYIDTQLHLDSRPVEGYFFKWSKDSSGQVSELVSGTVPKIDKISGAFPSPQEVQQIIDSAIGTDTEQLSKKEIWSLNSNRVLTPQVKVEVQSKSRSQRSSGHEYWFISVNSGKIVKRVEADRN